MASSVASPPIPANQKIASNLGLLLSLQQDGDQVSSKSLVGQELAHIQDNGAIEVSARFARELSAAERAEIEALGVEFQQVAGWLAHLDRFYGLLVPVEAVDGLAAHPLVEWLEAAWRPVVPAPLDTSIPASNVPAVWQVQKTMGAIATPLTGKGVTIANFDTGIDVQHPAFLDGSDNMWPDECNWDSSGDGFFTPGVDKFPLATAVLRYWDAQGDPNNTGGFDVTQDWVYQDDNGNLAYDYTEYVFMAHDTDGDNVLEAGECLRARGTLSGGIPDSKIAATLDGSGVQRTRGVDLEQTPADTNGHGTGVAGILVAGNALFCAPHGSCSYVYPNTRRYTGVAPNADLLVADRVGLNNNFSLYIPWALAQGADIMLHELGGWVYEYMDGSSNYEQMMDAASVISGVLQVVPTGNIHGERRHRQYNIAAGGALNHSFNVPVGQGIDEIFASMTWLTTANDLTVSLTTPTGGAGNTVALPCTTPGVWQDRVTTDGHTIRCQRAANSDRGTALYNIYITQVGGVVTGNWLMSVNNPGASPELTNFYIADQPTTWGGGAAWNPTTGNVKKHTATWPSTCDTCIGVASYATRGYVDVVTAIGAISPFSGRGPRFFDGARVVDVAAPGHYDIISTASKDSTWGGPTGPVGKYTCGNPPATQGCFGGTSAAGPHVAGVAALLVQFASNNADPADVEAAIQRGAVADSDTGSTPNDTWGYGKLNAYTALQNMMHDLGDAPDSSNHYSVSMSAYPGVQANFPTVYTGTTPLTPHGPMHRQAGSLATGGPVDACLGTSVSAEGEADKWFDEDAQSMWDASQNISPTIDAPNGETLLSTDNGLWIPGVLAHCAPTTLTYQVTLVTGTVGAHYVNVWFDWNRDGDWGDVFTCTETNDAPEWVVQDQMITTTTPGLYAMTTPAFLPYQPADPYDPTWIRITLSERKAPTDTLTSRADGRGPPEGYEYGETEDYYLGYPPVASFQVATTTTCMSYTVAFTNTTTGSKPITYSWDFGDGVTLITTTFIHPTHHYVLPGMFKAELRTIDAQGMPTSQPHWVWITVDPSPVAGFTSNSPVRANTTALFTNTSTAGATSYYWDFGDGIGASTAVSPTYVYTSTGAYVVTLIAYNDGGCSNTYTDTVTAILPSPFSISKTASSSVVAGQPLTYTIIVSNTGGTAATSVAITDALPSSAFYVGCGGGACSESGGVVTWSGLTVPSHGTISVTFVVTACSGPLVNSAYGVASWSEGSRQTSGASRAERASSLSEGPVTTMVQAPSLAAAFTPTSVSIPISETVTFTDASTTNGGPIVAWGWDFGDGEIGSGQTVDHTYTTAGVYTVTLVVTDVCGYTDVAVLADMVTVHQPVLSIGKQAQGTVVGMPLTFTLTVTNTDPLAEATGVVITDAMPTSASYLWGGSHAGGVVSWTVNNVAANGGSAQVTFAVTTCQATITNTQYRVATSAQGVASSWGAPLVTSLDLPTIVAAFDRAPMSVVVGESVYFTDTSGTDGSSIVAWGWSFGDGETGSEQTISHTYDATGAYTVTLVVTDACGYADTVQVLSAATVVSACAPVSGAAFTFAPAAPVTGATVTFTGTVAVISTPPIFYAWNFGTPSTRHKSAQGTSSVVTHTYAVSNTYTVVMTATNACGETVASDTITVESPPCTGLSDVSINGPISGYIDTLYGFTAAITPSDATTPTTYTWSPAPDSGQGTASASYQWTEPGFSTITLTAENCGGMVSDTHTIAIETLPGAVIDPITGGAIVYTDTQGLTTTVQAPPGAVSETTTLVYTPVNSPTQAISPDLRFAGHAFHLEAYLGGELEPGFVFSRPITITIRYSDDDVQGMDEESLTLDYWNGSAWEDAACGLYDRRPDDNLLSVPLCHLSEFALLGEGEYRIYLPLILSAASGEAEAPSLTVEGLATRSHTPTDPIFQDLQPRTKYDRMGKKAGSKR